MEEQSTLTGFIPSQNPELALDAKRDPSFDRHPAFTTTSDQYAHEIYHDTLHDSEIEEFLRTNDRFDSKNNKWSLPCPPTKTKKLVNAMCKVVRSVVRHFVKATDSRVTRRVVKMLGATGNDEKNGDGYYPCPPLVIGATGPSFADVVSTQASDSPESRRSITFSNMASYFTVKVDSEIGSVDENVRELKHYARYVSHSLRLGSLTHHQSGRCLLCSQTGFMFAALF